MNISRLYGFVITNPEEILSTFQPINNDIQILLFTCTHHPILQVSNSNTNPSLYHNRSLVNAHAPGFA